MSATPPTRRTLAGTTESPLVRWLLIGLALNFLGGDPRMAPGLGFASKTLLRWGIVLVGAFHDGEKA